MFKYFIELHEAIKDVHYIQDRNLVFVPSTEGRLGRSLDYDPSRDIPDEWSPWAKHTAALLKRIETKGNLASTVFSMTVYTDRVKNTGIVELAELKFDDDDSLKRCPVRVIEIPGIAQAPPPPCYLPPSPPVMSSTPKQLAV